MKNLPEKLLAAFHVEHKEHLEAVRAKLTEAAQRGFESASFDFEEVHRRVHSLKGAARIVGLQSVESLAHGLETLICRAQDGAPSFDQHLAAVVTRALDAIEDCVEGLQVQGGGEGTAVEALAAIERALDGGSPAAKPAEAVASPAREPAPTPQKLARQARDTARVDVDSLDLILKRTREALQENQFHQEIAERLQRVTRDLEFLVRENALRRAHDEPKDDTDAEPSTWREADEMLRALAREMKTASRLQRDAAWRLKRLTQQFHRDVRTLRIVPAESVFGGLRKMVRDLAREQGKEINVEISGLEVQADRQVLQTLKDPVMHLLRNAVAHGIEPSALRIASGKPPQGCVTLSIASERGRLILRITDDGAGLDRARILEEATRRGLLPADNDSRDVSEDLTRFLLAPGFSTEDKVTALAGRGMGLSVVDRAVGQLQGSFSLRTTPDGLTEARLSVPLALTGSQLALVGCAGHTYAIPHHGIERLLRLTTKDINWIRDEPFFNVRGAQAPVALADLAQLLGLAGAAPTREAFSVVLLRSDSARLGVIVDTFDGVQEGVVQELDESLRGLGHVAGALVLADGDVVCVLNPRTLMQDARSLTRLLPLSGSAGSDASSVPQILVVDDSLTTRTLEKSILEAKGFRVRLSIDGVDALEILRQSPVDLVIADVEMPRMDGFTLLHTIKGDPQLAPVPVILVTSRSDEQDRRKGLALGAEAYIVKQRFDQRELLETIDQIL